MESADSTFVPKSPIRPGKAPPARGATDAPDTEVEIKLLAPSEACLREIAALRELGAYRLEPLRTQHLNSTYLDTPRLTLTRHGVALRLRQDGPRWELTAKWSGRVKGTRHERPEMNVPLQSAPSLPLSLPDGPLHPHLTAVVMGDALVPLLTTDIRRRRLLILGSEGQSDHEAIAEIALDAVRIAPAADQTTSTKLFEVEIERRTGTTDQLAEVGVLLTERFGLTPSETSKFARGLELLGHDATAERESEKLSGEDSAVVAARKVVTNQLGRLLANDPGTRLGRAPEAVHDMRVATRRLRAAIKVFEPALPARLYDNLARELKWLGEALGGVRDLDVQIERLKNRRNALAPERRGELDPLLGTVEEDRTKRRVEMQAALDSRRYFRLLRRLDRFGSGSRRAVPRAGEGGRPAAALGQKVIKRRIRRALAAGVATENNADPAELHALRIRLKRLRYALEFFGDLTGSSGRRLVGRLVQLQDSLGAFNDAQVAIGLIEEQRSRLRKEIDDASDRALLELTRREIESALQERKEIKRAWKKFTGKRAVEDVEGVLDRLKTRGLPAGASDS